MKATQPTLFFIFLLLLLNVPIFAEEKVYTDNDLKKYGQRGTVTNDGKRMCEIVDYSVYENILGRSVISGQVFIPPGQRFGVTMPGQVIENKETCISITIRNNDKASRTLHIEDIKVTTAKGNTVSPLKGGKEDLESGKVQRIPAICFGRLLSPIVDIQLDCF